MKASIFLFIFFIAAGVAANGQDCLTCCDSTLSPVAPKPPLASIDSITCSTVYLRWQGTPTVNNYVLQGFYVDPGSGERIQTPPLAPPSCDENGVCTGALSVSPGTSVSWLIQAVVELEDRHFVSYPLRSSDDILIPACSDLPDHIIIENDARSLDIEKLKEYVFPNPVHSVLNMRLTTLSAKLGDERVQFQIFDSGGRLVFSGQTTPGYITIDVSRLKNGLYILYLRTPDGKTSAHAKFIKR